MSWIKSQLDWLTGQGKEKQAQAFHAKELELYHENLKSLAILEDWLKYNKETSTTRNNVANLKKRIDNYNARQTDLENKAKSQGLRTRENGVLTPFYSLACKYTGLGCNNVNGIGWIPLAIGAIKIGVYVWGAVKGFEYISNTTASIADIQYNKSFQKVYELPKEQQSAALASLNNSIEARKQNDDSSIFGKITSGIKTAGNVLLIGGLVVGGLWLYNNNSTVRRTTSGAANMARSGASRLRDEAMELRANY